MNPSDNDDIQQWKGGQNTVLEEATVFTVPTHTSSDDVGHIIEIVSDTIDEPQPAEVVASQSGDVCLPSEGDTVIVGHRLNGRPQVLGTQYEDANNIPAFEEGERVIGHPASSTHVRFRTDGSVLVDGANGNSIELQADGDIVINGGTTAPIIDISTTKDADGHVTDVSFTRTSNVFVP